MRKLIITMSITLIAYSAIGQIERYTTDLPEKYKLDLTSGLNDFTGNNNERTAKDWNLYSYHLERKASNQYLNAALIAVVTSGVTLLIQNENKADEATIVLVSIGGSLTLANMISAFNLRRKSNNARLVGLSL